MSIDHPHGGGEDYHKLITNIKKGAGFFAPTILAMANTEGGACFGGVFVLMDGNGTELATWVEGVVSDGDRSRFHDNASRKCLAMLDAGVVCSGMVANPKSGPLGGPVYDGGIKLDNGCYLAFSGFRALLDRAYCIVVGNSADVLEIPGVRYNTIMIKSPDEAIARGLVMAAAFSAFEKHVQ